MSGLDYVRPEIKSSDASTLIEVWGPAMAGGASANKPPEIEPIPIRTGKK